MALNWEAISNNIVNISQVLADFLDTKNPKKVEWVYMKDNGEVSTVEVDNLGAVIKALQDSAITPDELTNELKKYYKKVKVDSIRDAILDSLDGVKNDLQGQINNRYTKAETDTKISEAKEEAIVYTDMNMGVMNKSTFDKIRQIVKNYFAGSGLINRNIKAHDSRSSISNGTGTLHGRNNLSIPANELAGFRNFLLMSNDDLRNPEPTLYNVDGIVIPVGGTLLSGTDNVILVEEPWMLKSGLITDLTNLPASMNKNDVVKVETERKVLDYDFTDTVEGWTSTQPFTHNDNGYGTLTFNEGVGSCYFGIKLTDKLLTNEEIIATIQFADDDSFNYFKNNVDGAAIVFQIRYVDENGDVIYSNNNATPTNLDNSKREFQFRILNHNTGNVYLDFYIRRTDSSTSREINIKNVRASSRFNGYFLARKSLDSSTNLLDLTHDEGRLVYDVERKDYVLLEIWEEEIDKRDIVYPFGNVQSGIIDSNRYLTHYFSKNTVIPDWFKDVDTYSLFGDWQEPGAVIGRGWRWSSLTDTEKKILASEKFMNIYQDNGVWKQIRYRIRTIMGVGNGFVKNNFDYHIAFQPYDNYANLVTVRTDTTDFKVKKYDLSVNVLAGELYRGINYPDSNVNTTDHHSQGLFVRCCKTNTEKIEAAIPIAIVQRRNKGIYHPSYNPDGYSLIYYSGEAKHWYEVPDDYINSYEDCFDPSMIAAVDADGNIVSLGSSSALYQTGTVDSGMTARPDMDVMDLVSGNEIFDIRYIANKYSIRDILDFESWKDRNGLITTESYYGVNVVERYKDLFSKGQLEGVDDSNTGPFKVIKNSDSDYEAYYIGRHGGIGKVIRTTSTDGDNWTNFKLVLEGDSDYNEGDIIDVHVFKLADDDYRMFYVGLYNGDSRVFYATSSDGINWDKQGIVFEFKSDRTNDVSHIYAITMLYEDDKFKMWFTSGNTANIYYVETEDPMNWTNSPENVTINYIYRSRVIPNLAITKNNDSGEYILAYTAGGSGNYVFIAKSLTGKVFKVISGKKFTNKNHQGFIGTYVTSVLVENNSTVKLYFYTRDGYDSSFSTVGSVRYKLSGYAAGNNYRINAVEQLPNKGFIDTSSNGLTPSNTMYTYFTPVTQLFGDTRPLKDRVDYITVSGDGQTAEVVRGTYVLADGTYYRSLVDRGTITIDPDKEDYSNTNNWDNLGTNGSVFKAVNYITDAASTFIYNNLDDDKEPIIFSKAIIGTLYGREHYLLPMKFRNNRGSCDLTYIRNIIYSNDGGATWKKAPFTKHTSIASADDLTDDLVIYDCYRDGVMIPVTIVEDKDQFLLVVEYQTKSMFFNNMGIATAGNMKRYWDNDFIRIIASYVDHFGVALGQALVSTTTRSAGEGYRVTQNIQFDSGSLDIRDNRSVKFDPSVFSIPGLGVLNYPGILVSYKEAVYIGNIGLDMRLCYFYNEVNRLPDNSGWCADGELRIRSFLRTLTDTGGRRFNAGTAYRPLFYFNPFGVQA